MVTRFLRFLPFALLALNPFFIGAQNREEFRMESITSEYIRVEQGLSQNTANCVLQDSKGFIWIGTWSGLNRFDGYTVKTFNREYYQPEKGLTHPTVVGIVEDHQGYIWAATTKGLNRIDPLSFEIKKYTSEEYRAQGFVNDSLLTIFFDSNHLIWLGTKQGAVSLDPVNETFTHYRYNPRDARTLSDRHITCFAEDRANLWIGTRNGLNLLIRETGSFSAFYHQSEQGSLTSSHITCLEFCQDGYLWVGTDNGLNRLNVEKNWFEPYFLITETSGDETIFSQNYISALFNDDQNDLWVGTQELGLYLLDKSHKRFDNIGRFVPDASLINTNNILDIMKDNNGLYWVGTTHRGLVKLIPEPHAFKSYLRGYAAYGITEYPEGTLWFGTQNGVMMFDRELNRTVKRIEHDPTDSNSLSSSRVTVLQQEKDYLWIGTRNGLNSYHTKTGRIERFLPKAGKQSIVGAEVWGILKASDGNYWFSTMNGLSFYNPENKSFRNFQHDPENSNSLSSNYCRQTFEMEPGIFLIATDYGLNKYNQEKESWEVFLPKRGDLTSISSESILGMFRDSHDEIWVFTNGGGINKFDPRTNTFEHYTELDGLSDDIVYGMVEDEYGYFWATTNNGLSRFDPLEERIIQFDVQDGLLSNEFNLNGLIKTSDGEIFAGSVNGISSFYPIGQAYSNENQSLQFTEFVVHNETGGERIPIKDKIELPYHQNSFHVSFAVMDYLNPFKNRFEYKLNNFDENYSILGLGIHRVEYRKLTPGSYTLLVNGYNSFGTATKNSLEIVIVPAWFQTLFFRIFSAAFILTVLTLIIYLRYTSIQNKHRMDKKLLTIQNELVQSQKFALRSQMNPHFIFNSLNSIQNFVLKNDVDSANYYLSNFSILMRRVLEYSQHNLISLHEEIQLIELYIKMEKLRFSNRFEVIIETDPAIDSHLVKIPPMLLQPYLENAILHGLQLIKHKGILKVRFMDNQTEMIIDIEDNGIGRSKANQIRSKQAHKSKGLKNIEKRIQLYNKINPVHIKVRIEDLFIEDKPAGTLVKLIIPYELEDLET